jgi:hypothetical protein
MTDKAISISHVIIQAALRGGSFLGFVCEIYHEKYRRTSLTVMNKKTYDGRRLKTSIAIPVSIRASRKARMV